MNTLLTAVEAMRAACPKLTLRQAILYLYVCENEGLSQRELSFVSMMSDQTTSRGVRMLSSDDEEYIPAPLLNAQQHPLDRRILLVYLTERGVVLKNEIARAIGHRRIIAAKGAA